MTSAVLDNLLPWAAQVFVIASMGALLPWIFRLRHPRSQLAYFHLLFAVCLILPVIQPWQRSVSVVNIAAPAQTARTAVLPAVGAQSAGSSISWHLVIAGILLAGIAARLCWLGFGLWQIRKYRIAAWPLHPLPPSIVAARAIVGVDALFCTSSIARSPVTFGFVRPAILLPELFLTLPEDAQRGIACHELLHVRRKDWLVTVIEEVAAALFWFHPAVWWLLVQTRLAREQFVDAEVVRLTSAREPYINALLAIAGIEPLFDLAPAPLFLGKRHLTQRMHSLLREVPMSKLRLLSSYVSMIAILALAGWAAFLAFPLAGQAEVRIVQPQQPPPQSPPGYVVNRPPLSYPPEAIQKRIEGTVFVELTFNAGGDIVDSRVLSGPEELRQSALQTAVQGKYGITVARTLQVEVDFKLPVAPVPQRLSTAAGPAALSGIVSGGPTAVLLPGVTVTATNTQTGIASVTITNDVGAYKFPALSPGTYTVKADLPGFETRSFGAVAFGANQQVRLNFMLQPGSGTSSFSVGAPTAAAGQRGVAPGAPAAVLPLPAAPADPSRPSRVRIGAYVAAANLIQQVTPVYPQEAKDAKIQGAVVLEVQIDTAGSVENLTVVTGHPLLIQAAIDAVKQWSYRPTLLNGQAVPVVTTITVNFSFQN